jgi:hypothetical protein
MSERMTSITLPGRPTGAGLADWGRRAVPEMIAQIRAKAAHDKAEAEAILAASDEDFRVDTYTGVHVQRNREVLQPGRKAAGAE